MRARLLLPLALLLMAGCGGGEATPRPADTPQRAKPAGDGHGHHHRGRRHAAHDWLRYGWDARRSNDARIDTGIRRSDLDDLHHRRVRLDGTVDSSPLYVGGRIILTTSYGRTEAIAAGSGRRLWEFAPASVHRLEGSAQITQATPIVDRRRRWVYAASPDGFVHKLSLRTGHEVRRGPWPVRVTRDPTHEKIPSALNLSRGNVVVTTGGYIGDAPPYQGHVVTIDAGSGRIVHIWNSLCSDRHRIIRPSSCPASDSAIWARAGAVIEPRTHRILVATGNAPYNGRTNWGDSVLELSPAAGRLLHSYTPSIQERLNSQDLDLGSTAPALLPGRLALQGGKDRVLRLLDLRHLHAGPIQTLPAPGDDLVFTTPAVHRHTVFVATNSAISAYRLSHRRLHERWTVEQAGTSPVYAGGLLYVYEQERGKLAVLDPRSGKELAALDAGPGHWSTPIAIDGRIVLPEGNANDHRTSGVLDIWSVPGR